MKNIKIKTSFVSLEGLKALAIKNGINFLIFISILMKNCLYLDAIPDLSVWLRNGSSPLDINRF